MADVNLNASEQFILEASVERVAGLISATAAHLDRIGDEMLADLHRLGLEDIRVIRELLIAKGVAKRPPTVRANPAALGVVSVRDAILPPDPLGGLPQIIDEASAA